MSEKLTLISLQQPLTYGDKVAFSSSLYTLFPQHQSIPSTVFEVPVSLFVPTSVSSSLESGVSSPPAFPGLGTHLPHIGDCSVQTQGSHRALGSLDSRWDLGYLTVLGGPAQGHPSWPHARIIADFHMKRDAQRREGPWAPSMFMVWPWSSGVYKPCKARHLSFGHAPPPPAQRERGICSRTLEQKVTSWARVTMAA